MSVDDDRKAGASAMARGLNWGSIEQEDRADAVAISEGALYVLSRRLELRDIAMTSDHIAGAAQFLRDMADALDAKAVVKS